MQKISRVTKGSLRHKKYRREIAAEQNMTQAITKAAIETPKSTVIAVKETENPVNAAHSV